MANNAFQDLINGLIAVNDYRMDEVINQASKQIGVEPISGKQGAFITQETTSDLTHDIQWIKNRGYVSRGKRKALENDIKGHYKQITKKYSNSIDEKINAVKEDFSLSEKEREAEIALINQTKENFLADLKEKKKEALDEINSLPVVKSIEDKLPATRGAYLASIKEKAEKVNNEMFKKLTKIKESDFKNQADLQEWAKKEMDSMYEGLLFSPTISVSEWLKKNPPKDSKSMANVVSQPRKTINSASEDKAIRDVFHKNYKKNPVDIKKWMKSNFSYDTETNEAGSKHHRAATIAFARYVEDKNGEMIAEAKSFFLQYNPQDKTFNESSATVLAILNALNAKNSKKKEELLESALQMRSKLGLSGNGDITAKNLEGIWQDKIAPYLTTPEDMLRLVEEWGINGGNLWGFNNSKFDSKMVESWLSDYYGKTDNEVKTKLSKVFDDSKQNDLLVMAKKAAKLTSGLGGLRKGANFLIGNSKVADSQIAGIINLQGFVKILKGSSSSSAHDESDDAINTLRLAEQAATSNFFSSFFGALEQGIRNRLGSGKIKRNEHGYFSDEYKNIVYDSADVLKDVFNENYQPEGLGKVDTRVPNQQVVQKFARLGKDVRNLASSEFSVDRIKEKIVDEYAKRGVGVKFQGNKVGFYSLEKYSKPEQASWDDIAVVEMAELDDSGSLRKGRQAVSNLTYLDYLFHGEGKSPTAAIYSGFEAQYQHLLNIAGYKKDDSGNFVDSAIVSAIKHGDMERASNIAGIGVSSVFSGAPAGTSSAVLNEIDGMMSGYKNPEQLIVGLGNTSTMKLAERVLRFHAEQVQEIYDNNPSVFGTAKFNPDELSSNEYFAIHKAYAMIASGFTDEKYFTGADPLLKALVTDKRFRDFRSIVETFAAQSLIPEVASIKEEGFGASQFPVSGARQLLPLNIYDDQGSRASHQVFKYAERVNAPKMARQMLFSSQIGKDTNIDYGKRELSQYLGAATTDAKLAEALQKLDPNIKDTIISVDEGGVIISESMAKELMGYRHEQLTAYDDEVNAAFIADVLGIDPKSLSQLQDGQILEFNEKIKKNSTFAKGQELAKGDVIVGLERVGESLKLLVKRLEKVQTGTKMLAEGGGRYTARVVKDDFYKELTRELGVDGAQFLYEEKGYEERHMMPRLRGRLSYMMGEALKIGKVKDAEELLQIMKENLQLAKGMYLDKDGRIYDTAFFDSKTKRYKYKDDKGNDQDLFDNKIGEELQEAVRKAFVEASPDSDFSKFGKALLGEKRYKETSSLTSQFINVADEVPYFDAVGSGDIDTLDAQGRVKIADREKRAFERVIAAVQRGINKKVIDSAIEEGLSLYADDQLRQFKQESKVAKKAKETISQIDKAIYARQHGGYSENQNGKALTLVAREAKSENELDIRSLSTSFKVDKGKAGLTEEQYHNTIMAVAREKAKELGLNNITIEYGEKTYLLADQAPTEIRGSYFPSVTDKANNRLFKALLESNDTEYQASELESVLGTTSSSKKSDYYKIAHSKDSQIFRDANEVKVGNASYSKTVGRNTAYTSNDLDSVNTVYINPEKLKSMMRVSKGGKKADYEKNIRNLIYMAQASNIELGKVDGVEIENGEIKSFAVKSVEKLKKIEGQIISSIVSFMKENGTELLGQVHRYPSTSGLDVRHTKIGVSDQLSRDAVSLSAGLSATINADYDGDKVWQRLSFLSSNFNSFEDFKKAYSAATELTEMDRKIAEHMEKWLKSNNKSLRKENEAEADYVARLKDQEEKAINKYVERMSDPQKNQLSAIFAKSNKEFVGKFSNISTNVRTFMQDAKMDETGAGGRETGLTVILRAYLESLEQDAISAKKVFKRLAESDGESAALDELQELHNYIAAGEFTKAVEYSQKLNLGFDESRQLEFARAYLMNYSQDLYDSEFKSVFEEKDEKKRAEAISKLVKEAWNNLVKVATEVGGGQIGDALWQTSSRGRTIDRASANLMKHRVLSPKEREAVKKEQEKLTEEQKKKRQQDIDKLIQARNSATFASGTFENQEGINYDKYHMRKGEAGGQDFADVLDGDEVTRNIVSVTSLFDKSHVYSSFADKQKAEIAAAKGTYAHKVAELLGKTGFTSVSELFDTEYETELKEALNALKRTEGLDVTEELEKQLNERAAIAAKTAMDLGFFDQGQGVDSFQETILGGKFSNTDKALAGQADLLRVSETEGIKVGDYKFSQDNSPATVAKRIAQASMYLYLEEKALNKELALLKEKEVSGTATGEELARKDSIEKILDATNKDGGRKVQIIRNYVDKSGEIFTEVIEADAIAAEEMAKIANDSQISVEFKEKIDKLRSLINKKQATEEQVEEYHSLLEQLSQVGAYSSADIMRGVGDFKTTVKDSTGRVLPSSSLSFEEQRAKSKKDAAIYISNYKQQLKLQEQIQKASMGLEGKTGNDLMAQQEYIMAMEKRLNQLKQEAPILDENAMTINGMKITEEQLLDIKQKISAANADHLVKEKQIAAQQKKQQGFLGKLMGGLKQQMVGFIDTSLAYQAIGMVRSNIRELINTTKELDSALVDIQIATGQTRAETRQLMLTYTDLAKEMGRTTQSVAQASNDWLRAGYEGEEAAKLTKASMMLSTLGMIEATDATTYLISTLKGWKISANEVIGVVDKLTAVDMAAAISAGELALAMSRANNSARLAGSDMNQFIGYVTTVADVTQKSAESVGESFKTIYSRFGNVKANKYAATTADMDAADYNSDEFENLNDIETVLTKQGIKLRETAGTWRDIDDVISDIAEKWKTWDKTTQNAVATVVAGTRQRENVITLFENWDNVAKYAEIAENAYGTATVKMSAYTDSIEASQYRLTTAVEEWSLRLNQSGAIKAFYDVLGFATENMDALILSVGGLLIALNGTAIITTFYSGLSKLGLKLMEIGAITPSVQNGWRVGDIQREQSKKSMLGNVVTAYSQKIEQDYNNVLTTYMSTLEQANQATVAQINTQMSLLSASDQRILGEQMLTAINQQDAQISLSGLTVEGQRTAANMVLQALDAKLIDVQDDHIVSIIKQIATSQELVTETDKVAELEKLYAEVIRKKISGGAEQPYNVMGTYYAGAEQREKNIKNQAKQSVIIGASSIAGGILGSFGGGEIGKQIGEELGDSGAGQTVGTVLGASIGSWAAKTVGPNFITWVGKAATFMGGKIIPVATKLGSIFGGKIAVSAGTAITTGVTKIAAVASTAAPLIAAATIAVGGLIAWQKNKINKQLKEMSEEFQEQAAIYSSRKGSDIDAAKLDALAKGVDNLGRNVSLTEEEYQEFLELNNSLAELYPELIVRTDEAGNHFVGMGDSIAGVTEKVKELIAQQQLITDEKMFELTDGVFFGLFGKTTLAKENLEAAQASVDTNFLNAKNLFDKNNYAYLTSEVQHPEFEEVLKRANVTKNEAMLTMQSLSGSRYMPENMRNIYEDNYAKIKQAYNTLYEEEQNKINAVTNEMADEMDVAVRQIYRNEFNDMTEEESAYWQRIRGNISAFDENNNALSDEVFYGNTRDTFRMYNEAFLNNEEGQDFLNIAMKDVTDYDFVGDYTADRAKLTKYLKNTFGEDGFDENEMSILIGLGFKVEDNKIIDDNNIMSKLGDLGVESATYGGDDQITQYKLKQLKPEDAKKAFELIKSGAIDASGSMSALVDLLYADRSMPTTLEGATKYASQRLSDYDNLLNRVKDENLPFENVIKGVENVDEEFSKYPTTIREALKSAQEEIKNSDADVEAILNSLENNINAHRIDVLKGVAQVGLNNVFGDSVLSELDGIIDTFGELETVLESIGNAYTRLGDAQKEYSKYGRLSTQTVVELMASNSNYAKVLEYENGVFTLAADAQKIMAAEQASATIVSLKAAQAAIKSTQAEKQKELAIINESLAQNENVEQTVENIEATKVWTRATGILVGFLKGLGASITALINGEDMGDAFDSAFQDVKAQTDSVIQEMNWEQKYDAMTKEELQNRKLEVEQEISDLQTEYDVYEGIISDFQKAMETGEYGFLGEDFGLDLDFEDAMTELEKLEAALENINKEWEAMQVYSKELGKELKPTEYFNKMYANLKSQETLLKNQLSGNGLTESERYEAQNKLQEVQVQIANLDDEMVNDRIALLETEGEVSDELIRQYELLLQTADTEEDRIKYTKQLNDKLREQRQLVMDTYEFQQEMLDTQLKYYESSPDSDKYESLMNNKITIYGEAMKQALINMQKDWDVAFEAALYEYQTAVDSNNNRIYTDIEANALAKQDADNDSKVREDYKEYIKAYEAIGEAEIKIFNDKIDAIEREISRIEDAAPKKWTSIAQIKKHYDDLDGYYNNVLAIATETLNDVSDLTDEQIEEIVDKANEATKQINENAIAKYEAMIEYQESVYSALTNEVQRYIDDLEKQKEIVEDTYDKELEKLQDKEDAIARTNKLIELQNNLLNAQKEKERVYREGIGWVYESNRVKVRAAEKDLDDFYRQDNIDDLNNAKDAELKNLDERIKNWEDYLAMLNEKYNEYNVLQEQRLLMELIGVESQKEVYEYIKSDMTAFTEYVDANIASFLENQSAAYLAFNSSFNTFLSEYKTNLQELQALKELELNLMDATSYLGNNNGVLSGSGDSIMQSLGIMDPSDIVALVQAGKDWNAATTDEERAAAHKRAEAIREKYGYSGGDDGSAYIPISSGSKKEIVRSGKANTANIIDPYKNSEGKYSINDKPSPDIPDEAWERFVTTGHYSNGIEEGPVTYTGLAMLHGTPSEPEYVLNNDQAYNLLRYMATKKMPEFDSTNSNSTGIQYIVEGDIVLEGVDNPQEFWGEVTKAMGNRWNVTKNR